MNCMSETFFFFSSSMCVVLHIRSLHLKSSGDQSWEGDGYTYTPSPILFMFAWRCKLPSFSEIGLSFLVSSSPHPSSPHPLLPISPTLHHLFPKPTRHKPEFRAYKAKTVLEAFHLGMKHSYKGLSTECTCSDSQNQSNMTARRLSTPYQP